MFRKYLSGLVLPLVCGMGCTPGEKFGDGEGVARLSSSEDIAKLSDEFDNPKTLSSWQQVYKTEGWGADQLEHIDIGQTQKGALMMMPYASTWYKDYRGVLAYKLIKGDFVVTTKLRVSGRSGSGAPNAPFSLAGIMVRAPRSISPKTWKPNTENYVFLSLGAGDNPGTYQLEVKTTVNSDSQLQLTPVGSGEATIRIARIGPNLIMMYRSGSGWVVHKRYHRTDFPEALQVGLTCYTDWPTANSLSPEQHNATVIRSGNPDLVALFDYVRYRRPALPANLAIQRQGELQGVSDQELARFLGE